MSGHPLDDYEKPLKEQTSITKEKIIEAQKNLNEQKNVELEDLVLDSSLTDGTRVIIGGILTNVSRKVTRNNTLMAFAKVEDLTGYLECVIFPKTLEKCNALVNEDSFVLIRGRVSLKEDEEPKILCEDIQPLELINSSKVYIKVEDREKANMIVKPLRVLLSQYKGDSPVYIFAAKEKASFRLNRDMWVDLDTDVIDFLISKFGEGNVKVVEG